MARAIDIRVGIGLGWLALCGLAMTARPAHGQAYPQAEAEAICRLQAATPEADRPQFWVDVDKTLRLTDRQRVELRIFCLGYQRGRLAQLQKRSSAR